MIVHTYMKMRFPPTCFIELIGFIYHALCHSYLRSAATLENVAAYVWVDCLCALHNFSGCAADYLVAIKSVCHVPRHETDGSVGLLMQCPRKWLSIQTKSRIYSFNLPVFNMYAAQQIVSAEPSHTSVTVLLKLWLKGGVAITVLWISQDIYWRENWQHFVYTVRKFLSLCLHILISIYNEEFHIYQLMWPPTFL